MQDDLRFAAEAIQNIALQSIEAIERLYREVRTPTPDPTPEIPKSVNSADLPSTVIREPKSVDDFRITLDNQSGTSITTPQQKYIPPKRDEVKIADNLQGMIL